jgi:hypothetical protein
MKLLTAHLTFNAQIKVCGRTSLAGYQGKSKLRDEEVTNRGKPPAAMS